MLNFTFEPDRGYLQEPFFKKDDENESDQERSGSSVSLTSLRSDASVGNVKIC